MSRTIQKFQKYTGAEGEAAGLSHVAGVSEFSNYERLIQESTTLNKWSGQKGVQQNFIQPWLDGYDGEVYVRKLDFNRFSGNFMLNDLEFWNDHKGDSYESGIPGTLELLLCGLRLHRYVRRFFPDYTPRFTSEPHCTELQAKRLKYHGLMDGGIAINRMPPWMWWGEMDACIQCPIGKPIRIK
jgi:hypothetical protein